MSTNQTTTKPEKILPPSTTRRVAEGSTYAREDAPIYVKFKYMYRDASNYKQNGVAVFSNHDYLELDEVEKQIRACLQDGERFIARQVHIRERFFETLHEADHPWHEFNGLDITMQALYDRNTGTRKDASATSTSSWPTWERHIAPAGMKPWCDPTLRLCRNVRKKN